MPRCGRNKFSDGSPRASVRRAAAFAATSQGSAPSSQNSTCNATSIVCHALSRSGPASMKVNQRRMSTFGPMGARSTRRTMESNAPGSDNADSGRPTSRAIASMNESTTGQFAPPARASSMHQVSFKEFQKRPEPYGALLNLCKHKMSNTVAKVEVAPRSPAVNMLESLCGGSRT